jgi:hypothetical protein
MMVLLQLGGVTLQGFEVPGRVTFGGAQALAVHKLPGGVRIIDAMGRDDADLAWSGVMSGGDASDRAKLLDGMRAAGALLPLSWDQFFYSVIISKLKLDYCSPWWIYYEISCKVLEDEAQAEADILVSAASSIASDLASAGAYVDVSAAVSATSATGALTAGTQAAAAANLSLASLQNSIAGSIASAEVGLGSSNLASLVSASGTLAQLSSAQAYVGRAINNTSEAS